jgi:hypothetical protein
MIRLLLHLLYHPLSRRSIFQRKFRNYFKEQLWLGGCYLMCRDAEPEQKLVKSKVAFKKKSDSKDLTA